MTYKVKYATTPKCINNRPKSMSGSKPNLEVWNNEQETIKHDKYYAYLKHRAQAMYRREDYELTIEQWMSLWTNDLWLCRGRKATDVSMHRKDPTAAWKIDNVVIAPRMDYLKRAAEYKELKK